jgi:hypothetical protein
MFFLSLPMISPRRGAHSTWTLSLESPLQVQSTLMEANTLQVPALVSGDHIPGQPITVDAPANELEHSNLVQERRRHSRHRYIERLYIGKADGTWFTAMTYEISAGGLSAATSTILSIGEKVSLSPVVDKRVEAIVRRKSGSMFGFEFLGLTAQIEAKVLKLCVNLPLFQSLIDV